jgi:26S proteasome regulatory subunit T1
MDQNKSQIQIALPLKIDASVTIMQVEEKPDVTYSDVGGCKEQIEKLHEVVEAPLISVSGVPRYASPHTQTLSVRTIR